LARPHAGGSELLKVILLLNPTHTPTTRLNSLYPNKPLLHLSCWDLCFLDAQTGSMNSMKMTIKVGTKFSSKSPENSTPYTVERGGYLYPWASVRYSQIAPLQLMYSSFTDGFWLNLQGERCTNLTFSHIHVLHACLLPTKVLKTFVRVALCI